MRRVLSLFVSLLVALTGSSAVTAQPEQILLPTDLNVGEGFGRDVAIDGDIAVIGVVNDNDGGVAAGAAYVFRLIGGIWEQEAKLIATDARPVAKFGRSVAVSGGRLLIGAAEDDRDGAFSGAAYLYEYDSLSGQWAEVKRFTPSDIQPGDFFGGGVAIDGDLIAIGSSSAFGAAFGTGALYVFRKNNQTGDWDEEARLISGSIFGQGGFGFTIDVGAGIAGDFVVTTETPKLEPFNAFVFSRGGLSAGANGGWILEQAFADLIPTPVFWGSDIEIDADQPQPIVLVGTFGGNPEPDGSVLAFRRDPPLQGAGWSLEDTLLPSDVKIGPGFASSLSIDGDVVVIGALGDDDLGQNAGAMYVYRRASNSDWNLLVKLFASNGASGDQFGRAVALSGDIALSGAHTRDPMGVSSAGSAYAYDIRMIVDTTDENPDILQSVLLASVYPNPSTGVVQLEYRLPRPGPVTVSIMNVLGQVVQRHRIEIQPAGLYVLPLSFEGMSGGTYFVQVSSNQSATTVRTILIR